MIFLKNQNWWITPYYELHHFVIQTGDNFSPVGWLKATWALQTYPHAFRSRYTLKTIMSVRFRIGWSVNSNRNQSVKWIMNMINQWAQFIDKVRPGFSRHSARFRGNIPRFISHKAKQVHFKGNIPCPLSHQAKQASYNKLQPFPCHWCIYTVSLKRKLPPSRKTQIAWHTMQFLSLATRFLWCRTRFL